MTSRSEHASSCALLEIRCHRHSGVAKTVCKMRAVTYVGMYVYIMYGHIYNRVWINRIRLPILHVAS